MHETLRRIAAARDHDGPSGGAQAGSEAGEHAGWRDDAPVTTISPALAVRDLFERHADEIYQYARYTLGDPQAAEDVVQDVFLKVVRGWDGFDERAQPRTWLWAVARNHMKDVYRQRSRVQSRETPHPLDEADGSGDGPLPAHASTDFADPSLQLDLERALRQLPEAYREVVVLRLVHDLSVAETARILHWSAVKVRVTQHRAVKRLRVLLDDDHAKGAMR